MSSYSGAPLRKREKDVDSCIFNALCCLTESCTPSCGFRGVSECFCLRKTICLEPCGCNNAQPRLLGFESGTNSDEICKIGLYCCDYALIQPRVCQAQSAQVGCLKVNCAFPCHEDYLEEPACAYLCISCYPDFGIAVPPTKPILFERLSYPSYDGFANVEMERGEVVADMPYDPVVTKDTEMT